MGLARLKLPSSGCVHFLYSDFFSGDEQLVVSDLQKAGVRCAYTEYRNIEHGDLHILNVIGRRLNLQHAPYLPRSSPFQVDPLVPFIDDLITLSERETGVVLFVDSSDVFLAENRRAMFRLIETFLIQVHHWMEEKKPCHLCFLMEPNKLVREQLVNSESTGLSLGRS